MTSENAYLKGVSTFVGREKRLLIGKDRALRPCFGGLKETPGRGGL